MPKEKEKKKDSQYNLNDTCQIFFNSIFNHVKFSSLSFFFKSDKFNPLKEKEERRKDFYLWA